MAQYETEKTLPRMAGLIAHRQDGGLSYDFVMQLYTNIIIYIYSTKNY